MRSRRSPIRVLGLAHSHAVPTAFPSLLGGPAVPAGFGHALAFRERRAQGHDERPAMEQFEPRTLLAAVFWDGGAGTDNWGDAANWNRGGANTLPQNGDAVTISIPATNPAISFNVPAVSLLSLSTSESVDVISGSALGLQVGGTAQFTSAAALSLLGGTISGGSWNVTAGSLHGTPAGGFITDSQITGDLQLDTTSANVVITGTTRFTAARLTANNAGVNFAPGYTLRDLVVADGAEAGARYVVGAYGGDGTLTIAASGAIRLAAGCGGDLNIYNSSTLTLINSGSIVADAAEHTFSFSNTTLTNNSTITVTAGILNISTTNFTNVGTLSATNATLTIVSTNWTNSGTIVENNSTLNLGGAFTTAGVGTINRTGGAINLTGIMNNTGATRTFNASTGSWILLGGTINNGTVVFSGVNRLLLTPSGGTLSGVQVNGDLLFDTTSASVVIAGTTRFTAARLAANNTNINFTPGYTLRDLVVAEGADVGTRYIAGAYGGEGTLTIAPTGVIRLAAGCGGDFYIYNSSEMTLINNGTIAPEAADHTLVFLNTTVVNNTNITVTNGNLNISPTNFTNAATLTATNSTLIIAATNWTNTGAINATGSTLTFGGNWSSTGTITVNNTTLNLGGTFNTNGYTLARTGGTVNLTGTLNNTGQTFTFNAATGPWNLLGGTINGGTVVSSGANRLLFTTSGGFLTDVQFNGDLLLDTTSASVVITGTTRFTAARLAANNVNVNFTPGYTLRDLVVAEGVDAGVRYITGAYGGEGTLTIAPTGVIRLAAGCGGDFYIYNSSAMTLINNGTISPQATDHTLALLNTTVINNTAITVTNSLLNISPTNFTNASSLIATGATITIAATNWINTGSINATNSTLTFGGNWSSSGTITVNNTTLNLGGAFTTNGFTLARTGGIVNLTGVMNNTGLTFTFSAATGPWNLLGGTVNGGTLVPSGVNRLNLTSGGGTLADLQHNGDLLLDTTSASVIITGTTRFTAARLTANNANVNFAPGYTLQDLVVAEGSEVGTRYITGAYGGKGTLTIAPTGRIRLAAGCGGDLYIYNSSVLTLINIGTVAAEAADHTLTFANSTFINEAAITVTAGTLYLGSTHFVNDIGVLTATNATITIAAPTWSSLGTISETNSTLNLGGTFALTDIGTLNRTGGTINLTGVLNNTGQTLTFNAATGSWNLLGGTINNGTLVFNGANRLRFTPSGGTLSSVQVNGDLVLDVTSASVIIAGTTRFTAARLAANNANVNFAPGYTLRDLVVAEGADPGTRYMTGAYGAEGTLIIAPTGVIRLAADSGGDFYIYNSSQLTLINNGTIAAEAPNHTLVINVTTVMNINANTLTGGAWIASGTSALTFSNSPLIAINNASVTVGEANSFPAVASLITNNGSLATAGGGTFTIIPIGGTLTNHGTITLSPGNTIAVTGNVVLAGTATLNVQVQGTTPATIGHLNATGSATLAGVVNIVTVNDFDPKCINSPFINAATTIGQFTTQNLPTPHMGMQTFLVYIGGEVRYAISPPSDYNRDGFLNSQDIFDFLTQFFTQSPTADFNHDGFINSQDFFDFIADFFTGCP